MMKEENQSRRALYVSPVTGIVLMQASRIVCTSNESIQPGEEIDWAPGMFDNIL